MSSLTYLPDVIDAGGASAFFCFSLFPRFDVFCYFVIANTASNVNNVNNAIVNIGVRVRLKLAVDVKLPKNDIPICPSTDKRQTMLSQHGWINCSSN